MINTSNRVHYLETGESLYLGLSQAIKNVGEVFQNHVDNLPAKSPRNEAVARLFSRFTINKNNHLEVAHAIEKIALTGNYHEVIPEMEALSRIANSTLYKHNFQAIRLGAKTTLLYLHKYKLAVLPYCYRRPCLAWLDDLPENKACYSTLQNSLREIEVPPTTGRDGIPRDTEAERNRWHFSCGMRICLSSSWFEPEDIAMSDIQEWRYFAYSAGPEQNIAHVPIINYFLKSFGSRIKFTREDLGRELSRSTKSSKNTNAGYLTSIFSECNSATELIEHLVKDKVILISSVNCFKVIELGIPDYFHCVSFKYPEALSHWTATQKNFLNFKRYESPARVERALGILNSYLFIYLPAWLAHNPNSEYIYPIHPHQFTASHYDFTGNNTSGRPLSFVEFHKKCGFIQNYNNMGYYSLLFDYIEFNLPADANFTNPVHKLPTSRKYYTVVKNIFTPDIFPSFVEYCWALESLCSHLEFNHEAMKVIASATTKYESIRTDQLGYIPLVFVSGNHYPILEVSAGAFSTIRHDDLNYFYPGAIRLALAQLETGIRTQGLQWLSSEHFLNHTRRSITHPFLLNHLFVNTDKVNPLGLVIFVLNRVLQLLIRQDQWRKAMVTDHGCEMLNARVNYERRVGTKFKDIISLFSYNTQIGGPFSDSAYYDVWEYICLSFQHWHNKIHLDNLRLVALIPAKATGAQGTYYRWEDWEQSNYKDGIQVRGEEVGKEDRDPPYCPVSQRTYVTPHGIRATFITQYSHVLPPAIMGSYLTGQTTIMVGTYNKGHSAILRKLEGTLNQREPAFQPIQQVSERLLSPKEILERVKTAAHDEVLPKTIQELGLISPPTFGERDSELNGLQIIARERSAHLVEASTHLCPFGMCCPKEITKAFNGVKRCALCPYAIFSVNNIIRVSAYKNRLAEDLAAAKINLSSVAESLSNLETKEAERQINTLAEDVVHWYVIEESLHAIIQDQNFIEQHKYLTGNKESVFEQIGQYELPSDSETAFMLRLDEVETFPHFASAHFTQKMERLRRQILLQDGKFLAAITNPAPNPSLLAFELSGIIREKSADPDFDLGEIIRLSTLEPREYRDNLLKTFNQSQMRFLE